MLEPRVLLSADILLASASLAGAVHQDSKQTVSAIEHLTSAPGALQETLAYNPADKINGIFDGLSGEALHSTKADFSTHHETISGAKSDSLANHLVSQGDTQIQSNPARDSKAILPANQPAPATSPSHDSGVASAQAQTATVTKTAASSSASSNHSPVSSTSSTAPAVTLVSGITDQLTATLKVANAPPGSAGPKIPSPGPLVVQDLTQYISNVLSNATGSTVTETDAISSVTVGGFIQLNGVSITFNATKTNSVWSGTVSISATSAVLFSGKSFNASISNQATDAFQSATATSSVTLSQNPTNNNTVAVTVNGTALTSGFTVATTAGVTKVSFTSAEPANANIQVSYGVQYAVTGTYTIGTPGPGVSPYALKAQGFVLNIGEALTIAGAGFNLNYDPNGSQTQTLATVASATAASPEFTGLPSATLTHFVLRADGFSFDNLSLTSAGAVSIAIPSIGNILTATGGATLSVSNFNVTFGTTASPTASLNSSSVTLTVLGLQLYPAGSFVSLTGTVVCNYNFSNFNGTGSTGQLTITISNFQLTMGEAFLLTTTGNVVLTPDQTTLATIASATISSPQFSGLGSATVTGLQLTQTGFTLGNLSITNSGAALPGIGNFLSFGTITVNFNNFALNYGASTVVNGNTGTQVSGTIQVAATNVVLFPNVSFLDLKLGNLSGSYNFGASTFLTISIPNLNIAIGEALNINLGNVTLTPGQSVMLQADATVTSNLFAGLKAFTLTGFQLKQTGFSLGTFSLSLNTGSALTLGGFLSFDSGSIQVTNFKVDTSLTQKVSGSISATVGNLTLFPGNSVVTSSFGTVTVSFDFGTAASLGTLTLTTTTFDLTIATVLSVTAGSITITPDQATIATIDTATLTIIPLNNLTATINNLAIQKNGFTIASANFTLTGNITLGGLLALTTPALTFTDVSYTVGGSLSGTVTLDTATATLSLGSALETTASHLNVTYNLKTGVLAGTMDTFDVTLPGFVDINGSGLALSYNPVGDGTGAATILIGAKGVNVLLGSGTDPNAVGVEISNATVALAVFEAADNSKITYALDATGGIALVGLPANTLSLSATTVQVRANNTGGAVDQMVNVDATPADAVHVLFAGNEQTFMGSGLTLTIGTFVTVTGDFGFSAFTDPNTNLTDVAIGAKNVNVVLGTDSTNLTILGASLGLLIVPGVSSAATTYALVANGGVDSLNGVPGLTLTASGLTVKVNTTGIDPTTLAGLPSSVTTPDGDLALGFTGLGAGNVTDIEGTLTLNIANFVSLTGDFGFQTFIDPTTSKTDIAIGAENVNATLGTATTNLTITGASLGLLIIPGVSGGASTYALVANGGTDTLNGVPGLSVSASGLSVKINTTGIDPTTLASLPNTAHTPDGNVNMDFTGLGSGIVKDIEGSITLTIANFVTLQGDFGFQSYTDATSGVTDIAIGAMNITTTLGSSTGPNLSITGASLGVLIVSGVSGNPSTYALVANGGIDTLNNVNGLTFSASDLTVQINKLGKDPATLAGLPASVHTPGGDVALDFTGLGAGSLETISGNLTLSVDNFASLQGSFAFETFTDLVSGAADIAVAATNVNASLSVGGVTLSVNGASLGLLILPGVSGGASTYALLANGGTDSLTGIPDFSLSASGLSVKINNTGVDPTTRIGTTSITTPGGSEGINFSGLGSGNVIDIEGSITLNIANFVSLSGDFGFQEYSNAGNTEILVGAKNVSAVLGTATTNVTISGASLGLLIVPGVNSNPTTYALVANGGTDTLNGVPGLTLSASGLTVKINHTGVDPTTLAGATQTVNTPDGGVKLDFTGLGAGNVTNITGSVTLSIANFVSLTGSFAFTEQVDPANSAITEILVGASGVTTFLGTSDQTVGVKISNAELGMVIYKNTTTGTSTYALYSSAQIQAVGLPTGITLSGTASVSINTTGAAVTESITTPDNTININFTDGTNGTANQSNIQTFSGSLALTIGASAPFTLSGDFSFSKVVVAGSTELLVGAANVSCANIVPDNNSGGSVTINNGTLGMVVFTDGSGYALTASATVSAGGGNSSGSLTLTIRRNTTTSAVSQTVNVGSTAVPVTFSLAEIKKNSVAFQSISISNASLNIDNTLIITAAGAASSSSNGVTTQTLTGVTLTLQDPASGAVLITFTASSASYSIVTAGTTFDGMTWFNGGKDVILNNLSFSLGGYVVFTAGKVDIQHFTNTASAVITKFSFTNATLGFYVNSQPMVSLTGSFVFDFSTTNGFELDSATPTGFSFMGQSISTSSGGGNQKAGGSSTSGTTLGPITLGTPSIGLSNFGLKLDGTLSVTITISDPLATITGSVISGTVKNLSGSFNLSLKLDLANPLAVPTNITASGFTLTIGELDITVTVSSNISLVLSATTVSIDPTAGPTADAISFGGTPTLPGLSATLNVGALSLTGGASNFAITGNGSFVAGNNFSVSLSLGQNGSSSLQWPSWLPIKDVSITLQWNGNNFNTDPTNFILILSATVDLSSIGGIPLTINGAVNDVEIDVGKLAAGDFPIISIGSVVVSVKGNLFGGTVDGTLIIGVVRFDSTGAQVDADGNLLSNGSPGSGTINSVIYGGITASYTFGGMSGFSISIGLSQYGPLSIYIEASLPTGIILDPDSGLALNNFRGGVQFGQGLPPITLSNPIQASDALQLRTSAFATPAQLTPEQWQAQLAAQVVTLYHNGGATDGWSNLGSSTITFEAGATLYDAYATQNAFKIDGDIFFDTSGKILVIGTATFGNNLTLGVKLYADLSPVFTNTLSPTNKVNILFLLDVPTQDGATSSIPPVYSVYGVVQFFIPPGGGFEIDFAGAAQLNVLGGLQATLSGNISMIFTSTSFQLTVSHVTLNVSYLGDIGYAAGSLTIQKDGSGLDIWGAFVLQPNLQALQAVGINVGGQVNFEINTTTQIQSATLALTSGNVVVALQPESFNLFINGTATFDLNGQQVFELAGTLAVNINVNTQVTPATFTLTIFVQAQLMIDPGGQTLVTFNANGLIYVDQNGFAAKMSLTFGSALPGISFGANFLLVMNTTGENISYVIPSPLPTSPPTPPVATVMGPNFASSNVLATISYETVVNGQRTLSIPDGAPPVGTTNYVTWTAATPSDYIIFLGRGNLNILNSFTISGTLNIIASYNVVTGISISVAASATLNLAIGGTNIFSFSVVGGLQIDSSGMVAAFTISRSAGFTLPSNLGFTMSASFTLEVNTTGSAVTVAGTSITVQPGLEVMAKGTLSIPGFTITGEFDLMITSGNFLIEINATVNIFGTLLSVDGFAGVYYGSNPGFAFSLTLMIGSSTNAQISPVSALASMFVISGTFQLEINTCSVTRYEPISNAAIAPGFLIAVTNLNIYLFGLSLTGTISIGISPAGLSINIPSSNPLTLNFFNIITLDVYGYLNPNGNFSFTATASISLGDPTYAGISGTLSLTISNTGFSASVSGQLAFLGASLQAGATVSYNGFGDPTKANLTFSIYIDVTLIPAINIDTPAVTAWGVTIIPGIHIHTPAVVAEGTWTFSLPALAASPAPPPTPTLGNVTNNQLVLYLGQDVGLRGANFGAQSSEDYELTELSGDTGSYTGQTIEITALGYTKDYYNVTSILVNNTLTGNDTINIASSITATVQITLGNGNNSITTGAGSATIYDYGTGSTTINAGSGGGVYIGGTGDNGVNGATYTSKGSTTINTPTHNFAVQESGYSTYSLNNSALQYGNYLLNLNGVTNVTITTSSSASAHTISLLGWTGSATINGQGGNNTIVVNPETASKTVSFTLSDSSLQMTVGGVSNTNTLSGIQNANLTGGPGTNTFTVSGWSGTGKLIGPSGSTNTVIASNNSNFSLTDVLLTRSGHGDLQLQNIQYATLTGGAGANTFTVKNWSGNVTLNGVGGNDTYNLTFTGVGSETVTVADQTLNSGDILNLAISQTTLVTANQITVLGDLLNYGGVGALNINGAVSGLVYNVQGTNSTTTTTIQTFGNGNVINVGTTSGVTPVAPGFVTSIQGALVVNGHGQDTLNVDDTGSTVSWTNGLLTNNKLTGLGMGAGGIAYTGIANLNIKLGYQNNVFTIASTALHTITKLTTDAGDTVNVQTTSGPTFVTTLTGTNTINVGSTAGITPASPGSLIGIKGALTITGTGSDTLNTDDSGDAGSSTGTLTNSTLTGLNMGASGITYTGIANLNISLGSHGNTFYVQSTSQTTLTTLNAGTGANTINLGSNASSPGPLVNGNAPNTGSILDNILGNLIINGSGADTLNLDDTGSALGKTVTVNATTINFVGLGTITYSGVSFLNISLGQGADLVAVLDTIANPSIVPAMVINGDGGADTFNVFDSHAVMTINGGDGSDSFYVFGNSSALNLNGNGSNDIFAIFASVISGQQTYRANAPVSIDGGAGGNNTLAIYGTVLNDVFTINGSPFASVGLNVTYVNIASWTVFALGGNNTFYVETIDLPTTLVGDGSLPVFNLPPGVNPPNLTGGATATSFNNTFYIGWQGKYIPGSLAGIDAPLTITNAPQPGTGSKATAYVDDSGDMADQTFTLTGTTLNSSAMGAAGQIIYDPTINNLNIQAGAGDDVITVNGTGAGTETTINGGPGNDTFVVNAPLTTPLAILGGTNTFGGDTLNVNGAAGGNNFVITGFSINGTGAIISYQEIELLTVQAVGGNNTFTLNGDSVPTNLIGGPGNDTFVVNSNPEVAVLTGGAGNDTFTINANSGMLTVTGATQGDVFTVNGNGGTLSITGSSSAQSGDVFIINGNSGVLTVNGGAGTDIFVVNAIGAPATLNAGSGQDTFTANAPLAASLTVNGIAGLTDVLTVNATAGNDFLTITGSSVSGSGSPVYYNNLSGLIVNGLTGTDTFLVISNSTNTTVNGGIGNDTFYVQTTSAPLTINTGGGFNVVDIGSTAPYLGSVLDGIQGQVTVTGDGKDTLNIDDTGSTTNETGTLTATTLTGLGLGANGIVYSGIAALNVNLASGNDVFNIQSTNGGTSTVLNTGAGTNTINIGSLEPVTGGVVDGILGALNLIGSGTDTLNVDDTGSTINKTGTLTSTTLTGLGMGTSGIVYSGIAALNINLGFGNDGFNIRSTNAATATVLNTGAGSNTVNIGSLAPLTGGVVDNIFGALSVVGNGTDTLNVDDSGSTANKTGYLTPTTLSGLAMGAAGISFSGLAALNVKLGAGSDKFFINEITNSTVTTIYGGPGSNSATLNFSHDFASQSLTLLNFQNASLTVGGDFTGVLNDAGSIQPVTINGSLTSTGRLNAGAIGTMTVGGDLAGTVTVTGLLNTLTVGGGTPGEIIAGSIHTITALNAYGNKVLQVIEGGIQRQIQATPAAGGVLPNTVQFAYIYDDVTTPGSPQLAIRITNSNVVPVRFDLSLVTFSGTAKFNLALVYATGKSGIRNITVEGNILTKVSGPALAFFHLAAGSHSGVVLPKDSIAGVEVRDTLPVGVINVAGIEGVAFAILVNAQGVAVTVGSDLGSETNINALWSLLGSKPVLLAATDLFRVPFGPGHSVSLYVQDDNDPDLDLVMTFTDKISNNASVTAYVQLQAAHLNSESPVVQSVNLLGDGGSFATPGSVSNITSTGALGSVIVGGLAGIGNITAPSIFGNIQATNGGITGIIQTTGIRIDPITGAQTAVTANLGATILGTSGNITGVTTISSKSGMTGEIICRGNLISTVSIGGSFSGVIAAQGDIGVIQRNLSGNAVVSSLGLLSRYGGINISGNDSGQIIALGNIFGNLTIHASLSGGIAAQGLAVAGLATSRFGILGNVTINSTAAGSNIVSGGVVGDVAGQTTFSTISAKGLLVAKGAINLAKGTVIALANIYQSVGTPGNANGPVIDAIFTNNSSALMFDLNPGDLQGLLLIETDLKNLQAGSNRTLTGTIP